MVNRILIPDASRTSTLVTIARPLLDAFEISPTGHRALRAAIGRWGIDTDGNPYFDRSGAAEAERATLTLNQQDQPVLVPERVQDGELVGARRGAGRRYPPGSHVRYALPQTEQ